MSDLLSDRRRAPVVAVLVALLVALCGWWMTLYDDGRVGYHGLVAVPAGFDDQPVVLSLVTVVSVDGPDRYRVAKGTLELDVVGPSAERAVGEEITVIGTWRAEGPHLEAREVFRAEGRGAKKRLGLVGLAALAVLLPLWFRPSREGLVIRGRG